MGESIHWRFRRPLDAATYARVADRVRRMLSAAGKNRLAVRALPELEWTVTVVVRVDDHHPFSMVIGKNRNGRFFCKTYGRPYSASVLGVLLLFKVEFGKDMELASDIDLDHGLHFIGATLGECGEFSGKRGKDFEKRIEFTEFGPICYVAMDSAFSPRARAIMRDLLNSELSAGLDEEARKAALDRLQLALPNDYEDEKRYDTAMDPVVEFLKAAPKDVFDAFAAKVEGYPSFD